MGQGVKVSIKGRKGYKPQQLFKLIEDGIRKRLPARMADTYRDTVVGNINNNKFGFQLSFDWVQRKERGGYDTRPYIMTGFYRDNITALSEDGHLVVGFKKKLMHPRAKMPVGQLALVLEYGDLARGLPARPLWRKSFIQFQQRLKREGAAMFKSTVIK